MQPAGPSIFTFVYLCVYPYLHVCEQYNPALVVDNPFLWKTTYTTKDKRGSPDNTTMEKVDMDRMQTWMWTQT